MTAKLTPDRFRDALSKLSIDGQSLYSAGFPGYPSNFSRDSLTYGLMAGDMFALQSQLDFSASQQGKTANPVTGEEPGKIHHEFPGIMISQAMSTYNACDTSAMFILSVCALFAAGKRTSMLSYKEPVRAALAYIERHTHNDIFYEDPAYCGADNFALHVTYWKDSTLNADHLEPRYPIVYSLSHFQNAFAVLCAGAALGDKNLKRQGKAMISAGIEFLWRKDHFVTAVDETGDIDGLSSDSLHNLLYIPRSKIGKRQVEAIGQYSEALATEAGFLSARAHHKMEDEYHIRNVWVHEQALLHAAARLHGLDSTAETAQRLTKFTGEGFPELLDKPEGFAPAGNPLQLWAIGAARYFEDPNRALFAGLHQLVRR